MKVSWKLVGYLMIFSLPALAVQQSEKMWSLLTVAGDYGKVVYYVEPQLRLVYSNNAFQQFLANSGVGYKVAPHWQIWMGQTISADAQDAVPGSLDEYRLWQQILWKYRLPQISLISRTRVEERHSLNFSDWSYRLRERVQLNKPLTDNLALVISNEVFININHASWIITKTFDQNRAYIGLEQRMSDISYLGIGYMNQYLSTPTPQFNPVLWLNWRIDLESKN